MCLYSGIRLVGGPNDREGRLEVYHNEMWGTVCSYNFADVDARTACMSLGFGYVVLNIAMTIRLGVTVAIIFPVNWNKL